MKNSQKTLFLGLSIFLIGCSNTQKDNKEIEYSILRGVNLSKQQQYEKAMVEYQKAYSLDPENLILLKELGYCYYQFGDYNRAKEFWTKALEISPKDDNTIKNLATLYYKERDYDKVFDVVSQSYNPNSDYYLKLKALINYETGDKIEAYELFRKMKRESFDEECTLKNMELLKELDKKMELYSFMRESYSIFMDNKEYTLRYTQNLVELYNMNREAQEILLDYIVRNGNDENILSQLREMYLKDGDIQKAESVYKLIVR